MLILISLLWWYPVTATGAQSEVGKIGILIDEAMTRATPLEQKLARLGRLLILVVLALCDLRCFNSAKC